MSDTINMVSNTEDANEDFASLFASQETSTTRVHAGQKVSGVIIEMGNEHIFLDVGIKLDGIIERKDLLDANGECTLKVGDTVEAWVTAITSDGVRLSRSMSGSGVAALEDARDAGVPVDGKVASICKGGYTIDVLGKRAFCPGSQMDPTAIGNPEAVLGKTMQFIITRVESNGRNIVVSRRALLDRERLESLAKIIENTKEGDVLEGKITRLAPFGAFMEIAPGVEGMIHISELGWGRVANADELVSSGDLVRAKVISITQDAKSNVRISLSRKQADGDPWANVEERLKVDSVVSGRVVRITPFGAFVEILPGVDGLVHISEMSWTERVHKAEDFVAVGDTVSVKIKEISLERRRLALSMRDAEADPWSLVAEQFAVGKVVSGTVESRAQFGFFINLAPGVTGLLPLSSIKNAPNASELNKLEKGQEVRLVVQALDTQKRRMSLAPEGVSVEEDVSWKEHAKNEQSASSLGNLGQALAAAMQNKK